MTPLHLAFRSGSLHCIRSLLMSGARTDILNQSGLLPVHEGALNGKVGIADTFFLFWHLVSENDF